MKNTISLILLVSATLFTSCGEKSESNKALNAPVEEEPKASLTNAKWVLKDSIMIDVMGNLDVYEYNPRTKLFLVGDVRPGGVIFMGGAKQNFNDLGYLIVNEEGSILQQFDKSGSGPESFGGGALDSFFMGDSSVAVYARKGLFQYALDGSFEKKYAEINAQDVVGFSSHKLAAADNMGNLAIGLAKGMDEATRAWDSLFQIVKPMRFYDLNKFETGYEELTVGEKSKYGYPDHPYYYPESKFNIRQLPPHVAYNSYSEEVYVIYPILQRIEVYDMRSGDLIKMIETSPDYFSDPVETGSVAGAIGGYEGLAWLNRGGWLASSNYHEIDQLGEYTLLRYNKALPLNILNPLLKEGYNKDERWPAVRRNNYKFYYQLFKDGKKVLPDFEFPQLEPKEGQVEFKNYNQTRGYVIGGDGIENVYVFMPNDGEVERDYELIYVYELVLE